MQGRKQKSLESHLKSGTYRIDRHGINLTKNESDYFNSLSAQLLDIKNNLNNILSDIDIDGDYIKHNYVNNILQYNIKTINLLKKYKIKYDIEDKLKEIEDIIEDDSVIGKLAREKIL